MCRGLSCSSMVAINHEVRIAYCKGERERTTYCWLCTLHCCPSHARHTCRLSCRPHVCVLSNRWTSEHVIVFARTLQLSSASHFRCCPLLIVSFRDQLYTKFRSSNENIKYLRLYANSMVRAKIYSASTFLGFGYYVFANSVFSVALASSSQLSLTDSRNRQGADYECLYVALHVTKHIWTFDMRRTKRWSRKTLAQTHAEYFELCTWLKWMPLILSWPLANLVLFVWLLHAVASHTMYRTQIYTHRNAPMTQFQMTPMSHRCRFAIRFPIPVWFRNDSHFSMREIGRTRKSATKIYFVGKTTMSSSKQVIDYFFTSQFFSFYFEMKLILIYSFVSSSFPLHILK